MCNIRCINYDNPDVRLLTPSTQSKYADHAEELNLDLDIENDQQCESFLSITAESKNLNLLRMQAPSPLIDVLIADPVSNARKGRESSSVALKRNLNRI